MKITLHVGPHKTGTTSLQQWMLENSKWHLEQYALYYPEPIEHGPGHAVIAFDLLGMHGRSPNPEVLQNIARKAIKLGAKQIFLSSEEFCMGLQEGTLENLADLHNYGSVELVVTLNSLVDRFLAEIATQVIHCKHFDLDRLDLPGFCVGRPGLWPNLLQELRKAIRPTKMHVILSQKSHPEVLFQATAQILNISPPQRAVTANKRISDTRVRLLNFMNAEFTGLTMKQNLDLSSKLASVLQNEGADVKIRPLVLPSSVTFLLRNIWKLQCQLLEALHRTSEITLYPNVPASQESDKVKPLHF